MWESETEQSVDGNLCGGKLSLLFIFPLLHDMDRADYSESTPVHSLQALANLSHLTRLTTLDLKLVPSDDMKLSDFSQLSSIPSLSLMVCETFTRLKSERSVWLSSPAASLRTLSLTCEVAVEYQTSDFQTTLNSLVFARLSSVSPIRLISHVFKCYLSGQITAKCLSSLSLLLL